MKFCTIVVHSLSKCWMKCLKSQLLMMNIWDNIIASYLILIYAKNILLCSWVLTIEGGSGVFSLAWFYVTSHLLFAYIPFSLYVFFFIVAMNMHLKLVSIKLHSATIPFSVWQRVALHIDSVLWGFERLLKIK